LIAEIQSSNRSKSTPTRANNTRKRSTFDSISQHSVHRPLPLLLLLLRLLLLCRVAAKRLTTDAIDPGLTTT